MAKLLKAPADNEYMYVLCLVGVRFPVVTYVKDTPSRSTRTVTVKTRVCKLIQITKNNSVIGIYPFKTQKWVRSVTKKNVFTEDTISP